MHGFFRRWLVAIAPGRVVRTTALIVCVLAATSAAAYKDAVGYRQLALELGADKPTGAGVRVVQVEASAAPAKGSDGPARFGPDPERKSLDGIAFRPLAGPVTWGSKHATTVAGLFYGSGSMAPGISDVGLLETNDFIALIARWRSHDAATTANARIWNHSWVGGQGPSMAPLLTRFDAIAHAQQWLAVSGVRNRGRNQPLLSGAFNGIAVGMSNGQHAKGAAHVDSTYNAGRTRPHLVTPLKTSSAAVPLVSATAALLIETGRDPKLSRDPVENFVRLGEGRRVYNAERATVVAAALLAGAVREFTRPDSEGVQVAVRPAYREREAHRTRNGLDRRFGAGQLNAFNSYRIVAAGEFNSLQDERTADDIPAHGFDVDPAFGGANKSNNKASYEFEAQADGQFAASLYWPAQVVVMSGADAEKTILHDMNLSLANVSRDGRIVVASNDDRDNSEHLYAPLRAGERYRLEVSTAAEADAFAWQYALAWRATYESRAEH